MSASCQSHAIFIEVDETHPCGAGSQTAFSNRHPKWTVAYGTHSLRRTKASLIYKATGNLRAVQILLGHTNIENTVRYLGVDIDDALTLSERTEI